MKTEHAVNFRPDHIGLIVCVETPAGPESIGTKSVGRLQSYYQDDRGLYFQLEGSTVDEQGQITDGSKITVYSPSPPLDPNQGFAQLLSRF